MLRGILFIILILVIFAAVRGDNPFPRIIKETSNYGLTDMIIVQKEDTFAFNGLTDIQVDSLTNQITIHGTTIHGRIK